MLYCHFGIGFDEFDLDMLSCGMSSVLSYD